MAITLNDLDAILGYDPSSHTVGGVPTLRPTKEPGTMQAGNATLRTPSDVAARSANFGIGAVGNRMAVPEASTFSRGASVIPSVGDTIAPDLSKPGRMPSIAGTLAGNPAADVVNPQTMSELPALAKPKTALQKLKGGLELAGNIAGNVVAPGVMMNIPGTELNKEFQQNRIAKLEDLAAGTNLKKAEAAGWAPMTITGPNGELLTVPMKSAPTVEAADVRAEQSGKNVEAQQAGAEKRTEEQQAGAQKRTEEQQAGAASREQPKTITMYDKDPAQGGKLYQYSYDPQTKDFKKLNPAPPTAASLGIFGSVTPLVNQQTGEFLGTMNTKTGQMSPLTAAQQTALGNMGAGAGGAGGVGTAAEMRTANARQNQFNTQYMNPANQTETQYRRANEAVQEYNNNPKTGAAAMVIFAQHLGTTLGGIKGAAIGEGAQKMHQDAIGLEDRAKRFVDYIQTGQPLSTNQVHDFMDLIQKTRDLQWETTAREAARRHMPIDFLPPDASVRMTSPDGKETQSVPAARVQEFVDKGGKIVY